MLTIINPATEAILAQISEDSSEAIATKVAYARAAQAQWAQASITERCQVIARFRDLLATNIETHARTLTAEIGKPIAQAYAEIRATGTRIQQFLTQAETALATETIGAEPELTEQIGYEPLGTIAHISTWSDPYFSGTNTFIPALLAGNAVIYKPSELTTLTGQAIAQRLQAANLPDSLFQLAIGRGATGAALLEQPLDGIFFTGSYPTGRRIAAMTAKRLKPLQLELSSKNSVYVCDDADITKAATHIAAGAFYNTGQSCYAIERIYVRQNVSEPFVTAFLAAVQRFKLGDPTHQNTNIGPLARASQQAVLAQQIEDAVDRGAQLRCGGRAVSGAGYFFEPTVLTGVDHSMKLMQAESFGPVVGIQAVADDPEAVALMADSSGDLMASVYTAERDRAAAILKQLAVGSAYWNCCNPISPRRPGSGRGRSGSGVVAHNSRLRAFVQPKAWCWPSG